jgi:hypothetical protein
MNYVADQQGRGSRERTHTARVAFEAALVVSDSEEARVAWRFYHEMLVRAPGSESMGAARRLLDEVIRETGDEQLVDAKRRYDEVLGLDPI